MPPPPPPVSVLELSIECCNLKDKDILSKSDPMVSVYERRRGTSDQFNLIGETELIQNNLNPKFTTPIKVDFFFEELQELLFKVYDVDGDAKQNSDGTWKEKGNNLGEFTCLLSEIITAKGSMISGKLKKDGKDYQGTIQVTSEEMAEVRQEYVFHWKGEKLANRDGWFGKSDPFIVLSKKRELGTWTTVHKSETIKNNLNPVWAKFKISSRRLCQGDIYRPIRFDCNDADGDDKFDSIGYIETNTNELLNPNMVLRLKHPKGKDKGVGTIQHISPPAVIDKPSFTAFIAGGMEISVSVAIDFTASNGPPSQANSLHHRSNQPGQLNQYEQAIWAVGSILAPYDSDQNFAVYGYGAALPPNNIVSHCFNLNGNATNPLVTGVHGIMGAYQQALVSVNLSGPTLFQPVIDQAAAVTVAMNNDGRQKYTILLIITDGAIMDMHQTLDSIVKASRLPMSIVIVGVGSADFTSMDVLDGDGHLLKSPLSRIEAARDIVQFVEMRKYQGPGAGPRLARDTLAEIPDQVVDYFMSVGVKPNPPRQ